MVRFKGNGFADSLAKQGALMHPPCLDEAKEFKVMYSEIKTQLYHMVDCLKDLSVSRAETQQGKLKRLPDGFTPPTSAANRDCKRPHRFCWRTKYWVCEVCLFRTKTISPTNKPSLCPGPPLFAGLLSSNCGHRLWHAGLQHGGAILYCDVCFHYAAPHPRLLCKPCIGSAPNSFSSERFYLRRRLHPITKERLLLPILLK